METPRPPRCSEEEEGEVGMAEDLTALDTTGSPLPLRLVGAWDMERLCTLCGGIEAEDSDDVVSATD